MEWKIGQIGVASDLFRGVGIVGELLPTEQYAYFCPLSRAFFFLSYKKYFSFSSMTSLWVFRVFYLCGGVSCWIGTLKSYHSHVSS